MLQSFFLTILFAVCMGAFERARQDTMAMICFGLALTAALWFVGEVIVWLLRVFRTAPEDLPTLQAARPLVASTWQPRIGPAATAPHEVGHTILATNLIPLFTLLLLLLTIL